MSGAYASETSDWAMAEMFTWDAALSLAELMTVENYLLALTTATPSPTVSSAPTSSPTPLPTSLPTASPAPTPFIAQSCIELAQSGYLCGGAARWLIDPNGGDTSDAFPVRCQPSGGLTLTPGDSDNALCTSFAYRYSTVCGGSNDADCLPSQAESGLPDAAYTQACGV